MFDELRQAAVFICCLGQMPAWAYRVSAPGSGSRPLVVVDGL